MGRKIYGKEQFAQELHVSESTIDRWLKRPEAACFQVQSMSNEGGGYGRGYTGDTDSLHALKNTVKAQISERRRQAAKNKWNRTDVSSGSNAPER